MDEAIKHRPADYREGFEIAEVTLAAAAERRARAKILRPDLPMFHFCGDSHLLPIEYAYDAGWFGDVDMVMTRVGGATAVGLRHPKSKTQALPKYRRALLPYQPGVIPVFQLGEVDCGFVIWHRAAKYGESIEEQLSAALTAYFEFLGEISAAGYGDLIVTGATLPTILDGVFDGEVAHLRRSVTATIAERTALTLDYNGRLEAGCAERGFKFFDLGKLIIDPATGIIADEFRHTNPLDHHLHPERAGRLWASEVLRVAGLQDEAAA